MRYSFISEGESHYICMHAETAMYLRLKGEGFAEQCLQNRILFRKTTEETVDQEFSDEKLFLDLSYLQVMEEGVAELLINAMQKWISCNCEVYLIKTEPELYEGLKPELECLRTAGHLTVTKDAYNKIHSTSYSQRKYHASSRRNSVRKENSRGTIAGTGRKLPDLFFLQDGCPYGGKRHVPCHL